MSLFNADTNALAILESVTADLDFTIPNVDLDDPIYQIPGGSDAEWYQQIPKLTIEQLTTRQVGGDGAFDALMDGFKAHLRAEYDAGRITGAEYTKAYIALTESAMAQGVQFLLQKDQAYWSALQAQIAAINGRVQLQTAKVQLASAQLEAMNMRAQFALTTMKLATEDAQFAALSEQYETQRGQTMNTRSDGTIVAGSLGKQKELYAQQIISYQRNSELAAAKVWSDAWITQKTIDEALAAPTMFQNTTVNSVLEKLKISNGL